MISKKVKFAVISAVLCLVISVFCGIAVFAENGAPAEELTDSLQITFSGGQSVENVTDDSIETFVSVVGGSTVNISCGTPMGGLYIMWNKIPGEWSYTIDGSEHAAGENGFLHEYIELDSPTTEITVNIPQDGAQITDIYAFSEGDELPDWVQVWEEPYDRADIVLFSTHSDDEQLFFAGLLPYYAIEREAYVQVVYMTNHWDTTTRPHEQLNGLWTVGIRNYPIISEFPDDARSLGSTSESTQTVLERARSVYNEDDWIQFEVEMIRRFKPQVIVGHDINGEYRHGAHILNTDALMQAVELSNDETYDADSVETYGVWDVKKTYIHLYDENQIVMDYDTPYESMGGKTPFEMSKLGYACHLSQQWTWFTDWVSQDKATDIATYSPCRFGLYRTTVGEDVLKNDMLENITPWAEIIAQEEAERLAQEEAERLSQEAAESAQQSQAEQNAQNAAGQGGEDEQSGIGMWTVVAICAVVLIIAVFAAGSANSRRRARRRRRRRLKKYRGEHRKRKYL